MNSKVKRYLWWFFVLVNIAIIITIWWLGSAKLLSDGNGQLIAMGRFAGLFGEFCLALMFLFIGRVSFLDLIFGHDQLNKLHRFLGYGVVVFLLSHPLLLVAGYAGRNDKSWWYQLQFFLNQWDDIFPALIGVLLMIAVIVLSLPVIKRLLKYEFWHGTHLLMYLAFIMIMGHQTEAGDFGERVVPVMYWYAFNFGCLGLVILYRWLRPLYLFYKHRFYVDRVVKENNDIYSVYIKGDLMSDFKFKAGQFANLYILDKNFFWPHPFSFSSQYNGDYLRFTIKSLGDYSRKIANLKLGTRVVLDGPLGKFVTEEVVNDKFLLIAGGVGVTPIMALAQSLAKQNKDLAIIYAVKEEKDLVFEDDLKKTTNKYFSFLSCQANEFNAGCCYGGYLDKDRLASLIKDYQDRDVYLCGPAPMMSAVVSLLKELGLPKQQIHFEKFGY